ncbi:TrkA family potassium uptake protein [Halococcus sp. IIIV-5B]|uniref:potassium channel family protein n=1 Tax=Halococcus sp. IIIV-5B TaxID=2321230 RepID=UPI000E74F93C|nr:NAD-binding protein [Halococcus sp. IIIV-5B]RJS97456.1 TrkA family potassium uptake protein [Halococcus sp. IIIV-5B]
MNTWQRRALYSAVSLGLLILGYAVVYDYGMATFEGEPTTFLHALQVVVETFTTTGFGSDAGWTSPAMNVIVIVMDLTGVALIFLALPAIVFPLLEETFSTSAPTRADLDDHVVVCEYTPRGETLIEELRGREIPYVVVESDRDRADDLHEDGVSVVYGDPESETTLERVNLDAARALVADSTDEANASIALAAGESGTRIIAFVEDTDAADYLTYAGADDVFSPRRLVGESLADKVTTAVSPELRDAVEISDEFEVAELTIRPGSDLAGVTIAESRITERTGAHVIGAWLRGAFVSPPGPDTRLDEHSLLLVAGQEEQLEALKRMTTAETRPYRRGNVVITGRGEVGSTVDAAIAADGLESVVVDLADKPGVDIVGDATEEAVLKTAGLDDALAVVLALPDDTQTVFAALVIRELYPDIEILARAKETESVRKLYRAGADYVLALATVSGRMLASTILDEDVMDFDSQIEVLQTRCPNLAGRTLAEADVRARTGCTVVAVERDGEMLTDIGADFELRTGDEVVVVGTDEDVNRFTALAE